MIIIIILQKVVRVRDIPVDSMHVCMEGRIEGRVVAAHEQT